MFEFEISKYGAGATESSVHPIAFVALIVTILLILLLPRKNVIIAVLCFAILIPSGQQFYVGGVHLFIYRIMVLVGLLIVKSRKGQRLEKNLAGRWNAIDKSFFFYVLIRSVAFSLQYQNFDAVINQVGFVWDSLCGYFLMRSLILDNQDVERALKCVSCIFAMLAVSMIIEQIYMVNLFGYIGGHFTPDLREGSVRSVGSFRHPITAGNAAAASFPVFMCLWYRSEQKSTAVLGMIAASIMTMTTRSSGPLLALAAGIIALRFWPLRRRMRSVRWTAAFSLLILHFLMKAPVWFLIARIDLTGSSSSYHRANLVDTFIRHFWEWWLVGTPNHHNWGWDLWDVQNQYVSIGVEGGLCALVCFVSVIVHGFSLIGKARKSSIDEKLERCLWALGATLFSYTVAFLGVNLFDQSQILWYMLLAMISASTVSVLNAPENLNSDTNLNYA